MKILRKYKLIAVVLVAGTMLSATVVNKDKLFEITKNIELFVGVYQKLNADYVDELDPGELMQKGIEAMMNSLDPYTIYWSGNEIESRRLSDESKYQGFGTDLILVDGVVTLINPDEKGSAVKAGLKAGDQILAINGNKLQGKTLEEIEAISLGVPGSKVNLEVKPLGSSAANTVVLTRGKGGLNNVPYSGMLDDDIAYITLTQFTADASGNIKKAYEKLKDDHDIKGLVLDLRSNPGGLLTEAIALSGLFIPTGKEVVSVRGKIIENNEVYKTTAPPMDVDLPLVVMIDGKSASASEIVSGVMQDYDRGVVLGQRSYGKGLVQRTHQLGYNAQMKLTISKYYIPSGRCIQAVEYKDGEPVDIPDEKRSRFKTVGGREVLDGGGVTPDVIMEKEKRSEFTTGLVENHMIFKFVNEYVQSIDSIKDAKAYAFDDAGYSQFVNFVKKSGYTHTSILDKELTKLEEDSKYEGYKEKLKDFRKGLKLSSDKGLQENKAQIMKLIEQELVARFLYRSGMAANRLNGDQEVVEAVKILKDKSRYNKILGR